MHIERSAMLARTGLGLYALLLFGFIFAGRHDSANVYSRLGTTESLVERGEFMLDGSLYAFTIDKVRVNGHFYSHQPPATAVIGALAYFPLYECGLRLFPPFWIGADLLFFFVNGLAALIAVICFYRCLALFGFTGGLQLLMTAVLGTCTLLLSYSVTYNSHGVAAASLIAAFYCYLRAERGSTKYTVLSGFAFSLTGALEHAALVYYALFAVLVLSKRGFYAFVYFVLPASLTMLPTLYYYRAVSGSIAPLATRPEFFEYPGSYWSAGKESLTGIHWNTPIFTIRYAFRCLFGSRGFLLYNPVLTLGLIGTVQTITRRGDRWLEALAIAVASIIFVGYYVMGSTNYSGQCYSIRWFVPIIPVLMVFAGPQFQKLTIGWRRYGLALLLLVSAFYAFAGAMNPWVLEGHGYATPFYNVASFWGRIPNHDHSLVGFPYSSGR
jgi:hypothetical protein